MKKKKKRKFRVLSWLALLAVAAVALVLSTCSNWDKRWTDATRAPVTADSLMGPWEGTWTSEGGHSGALKCILSREPDNSYQARFHASFWGVMQADYDVTLHGTLTDGVLSLEGEKDLGLLGGGVYRYKGTVTSDRFRCDFTSKYENGVFDMKRPTASTTQPSSR